MRLNITTALILLLSCLPPKVSAQDSIANRIEFNSNKFKYILENIYLNYVDSVDIDNISEKAFNAMLQNLDKQSVYLSKNTLYKKHEIDEGVKISFCI